MSCCSTVFFGTKGMALVRRLALRRSGFAWRFKDGSAPKARLTCLIFAPCGYDDPEILPSSLSDLTPGLGLR